MKDYATVASVDTVVPMIRVSMTMKITMYVLAVMVQGVLNVRSNIMKRVIYLNLTDCSVYETYVSGAVPYLKGFKVLEVIVA